ncbi:MAG: hypothetical protein U9P63_03720 [Patescibacteria group bacterium]|nr:hypothetical protein [Patescibacteria group bacterium]
MAQIKKTIYFLSLIVCCFLLFFAAQKGLASQAEVTLTWSTDTYTPHGYKGKALPARGSIAEVVAVISTWEFDAQKLTYDWFLNDKLQKSKSGEGKQSFKFNIGERISQKRTIKVIIKNKKGDIIGRSSYLTLSPQEPEIVLKTKALLLDYSKSVPKYQIVSGKKTNFTAQPFFFNIKNADGLDYQWILGNKKALQTSGQNLNSFTIEIDKIAAPFKQNLTVRAENKNNPIQRTRLTAEIVFVP